MIDEEILDAAGGTLWAVVYILVGIGAAELAEWAGVAAGVQWIVGIVVVVLVIFCAEWVNNRYDELLLDSEDEGGP